MERRGGGDGGKGYERGWVRRARPRRIDSRGCRESEIGHRIRRWHFFAIAEIPIIHRTRIAPSVARCRADVVVVRDRDDNEKRVDDNAGHDEEIHVVVLV